MKAQACAFSTSKAIGLLCTLALLFGATIAYGATRTWTGGSGSSDDWNDAGNWLGGQVPQNGDDVLFPAGAAQTHNENVYAGLELGSITFEGTGGYYIDGNALVLSDGIVSTVSGAPVNIYLDIELDASQEFESTDSASPLQIYGDIDLGVNTLTVAGAGLIVLSGDNINGSGGIIKTDDGRLSLQGSGVNWSSWSTVVENGTLSLGRNVGPIISGSLTIGDGVGAADSAIVKLYDPGQIRDDSSITINSDGWLDLYNYDNEVEGITLNGGHAGASGTGELQLSAWGSVTVNASSQEALIDGQLALTGGTITPYVFNVADGTPEYDLRIDAVVSGSARVEKTGLGNMALAEANTYLGNTVVDQGTLYVLDDNGLGTSAWEATVEGTGTLYLVDADVAGKSLTLNRSASGTALISSGTCSWSDDVELSQTARVSVSGTLDLSGVIDGTGSLSKEGAGTLFLSGFSANTFSGDLVVSNGTVQLAKFSGSSVPGSLVVGSNASGDPAATVQHSSGDQVGQDVTINETGTYDLNGYSETIQDLNLNDGADFDSGSSTLTITADVTVDGGVSSIGGNLALASGSHDFNMLFSGLTIWPNPHCYLSADVSGSGSLIKEGPGTMRISGNNTFTGVTTVNDGAVQVESETALGSFAGGTTVNSGTRMYLSVATAANLEIMGESLQVAGTLVSAGTSNLWTGSVTLGGNAEIYVYSGVQLTLSGVLGGSGGFSKTGSGTLVLSGTSANTYSGATVVESGTLVLGKTAGIEAISAGLLTIGDGTGGLDADVVVENSSHQIGDLPVHVNHSGLLNLNNHTDYITGLTLEGGRVMTGSGYLALAGDVNVLSNPDRQSRISGKLWLGGSYEFNVTNSPVFYPDLYISALVDGYGGIEKTGNGILGLYSANAYQGVTRVSEGALAAYDSLALGTTDGGTTVSDGAALIVNNNSHVVGEALTLSGQGFGPYAALDSFTGSNSWSGPVTLATDSRIRVLYDTVTLNISGPIGGAGGVRKSAPGTLVYSGATTNTYSGDTLVDEGVLELDKPIYNFSIAGDLFIGDGVGGADADVVRLLKTSQVPNTTQITIADSGFFDMNNLTEYFGSLAGTGHVDMGSGNLGAGSDGSSTTYSGLIEGTGELRKFGTGSLALSGNNTYSGDTQVNAGVLLINGSQPGSIVRVDAAGELGGTGTAGKIFSSGAVAPGASAGHLGSGSTTLNAGSLFKVDLNGHTPVDYDQLLVNGQVSLGNSILKIFWGYVPAQGDKFQIISNDGTDAVVDTFSGLAEGATVVAGNVELKITYAGGDGNDVMLFASDVTPVEDLTITSVAPGGGNIDLAWEGGVPFFVVEKKESLTNATWTAVTPKTRDFTGSVPADTTNGFYRVTGGN